MKEPVGRRPDPTHLGCGIHPRASSTSKLLTVQRRPRSVAVVGIQSRFENTGKDESKCPRNIPHKHIWAINPIRPHVPLPVKPESCRILVLTSSEESMTNITQIHISSPIRPLILYLGKRLNDLPLSLLNTKQSTAMSWPEPINPFLPQREVSEVEVFT